MSENTVNINIVGGIAGPAGQDGANGADAYQLWLSQGNTGTLQDFLDSLKGQDGAQGIPGQNGNNGADGQNGLPAAGLYDKATTLGSGQAVFPDPDFQLGQWGFSTQSPQPVKTELTDSNGDPVYITGFAFVDLDNPANSDALWTQVTDSNPWTTDTSGEIYAFNLNTQTANPAVQLTLSAPIVLTRARMTGPNTGRLTGNGFNKIANGAGESSTSAGGEYIYTKFAQASDTYTWAFGDTTQRRVSLADIYGIGYVGVFERLYALYNVLTGGTSTIDTSSGDGAVFSATGGAYCEAQIGLNNLTIGATYTVGAQFDNGFSNMTISIDGIGELNFMNAQFVATSTYHGLRLRQNTDPTPHKVHDVALYYDGVPTTTYHPFIRVQNNGGDFELDFTTPYTVVGDVVVSSQ